MEGDPLPTDHQSAFMPLHGGFAPGVHAVQLSQLSALMVNGCNVQEPSSTVVIHPPSAQELQLALRAGAEAMNVAPDAATRAILLQQDVLLRLQLSQRWSVQGHSSGSFNSLTASTGTSSSADSPRSPGSTPVATSDRAGAGFTGVIVASSPAKCFRCPAPGCPVVLDERCFARHIDSWLSRDGSKRLRSNQCPGFPAHHALLQKFEGSHKEQVRCLHAAVRSMLHPGCVAAQSPQGSGHHLQVEAFLANLLL